MQQRLDKLREKIGFYPPRQYFHEAKIFPPIKDLYFISDGEYVKIGIARDVESRLRGLQTSSPRKLHILTVIEYGERLEPIYHDKFNKYYLRGEWYRLSNEILREVEYLNEAAQAITKTANRQTKAIRKALTG